MGELIPFNPLDKQNLALSIGNALEGMDPISLEDLNGFGGAGVYAIYYQGPFYAYEPLAAVNRIAVSAPIYVGKADSKGKRKGRSFLETEPVGAPLFNRLSQHARSIAQATNLDLSDFSCRFLVLDDLWISLGESLLISRHAPVWNVLVEGFGNHDPGKGRIRGKRPLWDTLHPGRPWADRLPENEKTAEQIGEEALHYLSERCGTAYLGAQVWSFGVEGF